MARILAVDGGGSGFRKAILDGTNITDLQESNSVKDIPALADFVVHELPKNIDGIAFAMAGDIHDHQKIVVSPNLHFLDGFNLASYIEARTKVRIVVCNDMEAAATGMAKMFPRLNYFMGITWSSGIGIRIVKNGEILSDSEAGHMQLDSSDYAPICGCGKKGCAEAILGGINLERRILTSTSGVGVIIPADKLPGVFFDECYEDGQPWAGKIYSDFIYGMARFLANLQTTLHLPAIVWKGGVAKGILYKNGGKWGIRQLMKKMLMNPQWAEIDFHYCFDKTVKDKDALIGATEVFRRIFHI